jgi:hypothetical protein
VRKSEIRVGVATTTVPKWKAYQGARVRRPNVYYCKMASDALNHGIELLYLFSPLDVDWNKGFVQAWVPEDRQRPYGNWVKRRCAMPHAIYENVFTHLAVQGFTHHLRKQARAHNIPLFNPGLPNKWRMHRMLERSDLKKYLPKTERLKDIEHALSRIEKWGCAYIKPIGGYGGMGVTRVEVIGGGRYRVSVDRTRAGEKAKERRECGTSEFRNLLVRKAGVPHLIQQGLNLITLNGRKVDFRVVVQRDGQGEWKVVGIIPKLASRDGVVTNIVAGGQKLTWKSCLQQAERQGLQLSRTSLESCALAVAQYLTRKAPLAGILGFDLGIDVNHKVYMIEMNPKPARSLLTSAMRSLSAQYSTDFAIYLAKRHREASFHS